MEVSKLTMSDDLLRQTSSQTKMLLWIKAHPEKSRRTNVQSLSRTVALDKDRPMRGMTTMSIEQVIHKLLRNGLLIRNGGRRRADFIINYGHPMMPPEVEGDEVKTTEMTSGLSKGINKKAKNVMDANGGKSLSECILKWVEDNPDKTKRTYPSKMAREIAKDGVNGKTDSFVSVLNKLGHDGKLRRTCVGNGLYDYSIVSEDDDVNRAIGYWAPEYHYEVKRDIVPDEEEEGETEENNKIVKEQKMEEQEVNLPEGKVINLTININVGK